MSNVLANNIGWIVLLGIIGLLIVLFFVFVPVGLWVSSLAANVKISIFNMIGMKLRRVKPAKIVMPADQSEKSRVEPRCEPVGSPLSGRR